MTTLIENFIERLAHVPTANDAYNEYAYSNPYNEIRRQNFSLYLHKMQQISPQKMLIMEAPGYRGCRLTGVPVTSRKILLQGIPELKLFGKEQGYQDIPEPDFERIQGEQTATIVWGVFREIQQIPLIWNTFPFHPHKLGKPLTNRKPRKSETELGKQFLQQMMELFSPQEIVAVGNVAKATLDQLAIPCQKVRHPAQGGKNDFVKGIEEIYTES